MKIALLVALAFLAVACGTSATSSTTESSFGSRRQPCTSEQVETLVRDFLTAFNAGHLSELDSLFAAEPDFQWYSVKGQEQRLRDAAFDRSTLISYFDNRHRSGERLALRRFRFSGYSQELGHFDYDLTRSAVAIAQMSYSGKGAAICRASGDVIVVWSMGPDT